MNENTNIINKYQNIYTFSRRYLLLVLAIIIWTLWFLLLDKTYDKHILLPNEVSDASGLQNPFVLQSIGWIILPISQQNDIVNNPNLSTNDFLNQNIYVSKKPDRSTFETKMLNMSHGAWSGISVNQDMIKYFNLSCLFTDEPINTQQSKLCQQNLEIFVKTFPKYNIEEDLWNFEKIVNLWKSKYQDLICQNILQYIYQKWKIYSVFDTVMATCPQELKTYNQIVELKKFTRDEKDNFTNKIYNITQINDLKLTSWMQSIYQETQKPKIDFIQIKKFLNRSYNKTYLSSLNSDKLQAMFYSFNKFLVATLNNYETKQSLGTEDTEYIKNIYNDIQNINWTFTNIASNTNNNYPTWVVVTWDSSVTTSFGNNNDKNLVIDWLITNYLWATVTESKFISEDKYIYKITMWSAHRWLLITKTDWIWTLKTLLAQKQNWSYEKVNDFSVKFDDSENQRFTIFKQKSTEIYSKLK